MQLDNNSRHHAGYAQGEGWISETNTQGVNIVDNTTGWHAIEQVSVLTVDSASRLQVCVLVPDSVELGDLCVGGFSIDRLDGSLRNLIRTNITDVRLRPARAPTSRSGHLHTPKLEQYTLGEDFSVDPADRAPHPRPGQFQFASTRGHPTQSSRSHSCRGKGAAGLRFLMPSDEWKGRQPGLLC